MKPTLVKEESANHYNKNVVLIDTRSAFEFAGFHFSGSVNLNSESFLILKNARTKKRILDPDIAQIIERLAKRGISPLKSVVLISNQKDSDENKKWRWLLKQLDVRDVVLMGFDEYRQINKNKSKYSVPQAPPDSMKVWSVIEVQAILKKADQCFMNWSDGDCL